MAVVMVGGGKVPRLSCLFDFCFHDTHSLMVVLHAHICSRRIRFHDAERETIVTNTGMVNTLHSFRTWMLRWYVSEFLGLEFMVKSTSYIFILT